MSIATTRRTPPAPAATRTATFHEHEWELLGIEFEDGASIRAFECRGCEQVWFT